MATPLTFGRYTVERRLALGGMGEVLLGKIDGAAGFSKRVVIKRLLPHMQEDRRQVDMFLDEARLAARFDHPNLVQVFELIKSNGQFALVMEYLEGVDLGMLLRTLSKSNRRVPYALAAEIVANAASGLHCAHELTDEAGKPLSVVHRDISPGNILVTYRGGVKVVDFGIAKHESTTAETIATSLQGKFCYMSPEQARGDEVDRRSDIFSLGTVLYELLTVRPCFTGRDQIEVLDAVTAVRYVPLKKVCPDIPPALENALRGMLAPRLVDRYQTALEAERDLRSYLAGASTHDLAAFLDDVMGQSPAPLAYRVPSTVRPIAEYMVDEELSSPNQEVRPADLERVRAKCAANPVHQALRSGPFDIPSDLTVPRRDTKDTAVEPPRSRWHVVAILLLALGLVAGAAFLGYDTYVKSQQPHVQP